jgi:hypothetical protein
VGFSLGISKLTLRLEGGLDLAGAKEGGQTFGEGEDAVGGINVGELVRTSLFGVISIIGGKKTGLPFRDGEGGLGEGDREEPSLGGESDRCRPIVGWDMNGFWFRSIEREPRVENW